MKKIICLCALIFALPIFTACGDIGKQNTVTAPTVSQVLDEQIAQNNGENADTTEDTNINENSNVSENSDIKENSNTDKNSDNENSSITENSTNENLDNTENSNDTEDTADTEIDLDLTKLNGNMVYGEVFSMVMAPEQYIGKTVKMTGTFFTYENPDTGYNYFTCLVQDALACCSSGIEFILAGDFKYPEDYPAIDEEITVIGEFETYEEWGMPFIRLKNAKLVD